MRARVRGGERAAFGELYELYAAAVYNHALRLTGDWSVAEEVMSETFLAAWRGRADVHAEGGSLRPWLFGIATNKARNADRSLRRRLAFLARRAEAGAGPGGGAGAGTEEVVGDFAEEVAGRVDDARRLAEVRRVLGRLRRHEREVIALCVWGGLDYAQAAEALGVPVGTVRSRLSRARGRLREIVEREARQSGGAERRTELRTERRTGRGTEPRSRRGEVESEAAFAVLPIQEEAR
ncbi:RNA polymerase sigma factor [Streptomyces rishiriensis]|uniref:RNA polymerase sigma factor n=1 Tax=Streptomyces rishiriensis TaxID=68264 RepID=UPI0027D90913|nr:RNA polymerase sigma factor [Streptomyces rishiriensis]